MEDQNINNQDNNQVENEQNGEDENEVLDECGLFKFIKWKITK